MVGVFVFAFALPLATIVMIEHNNPPPLAAKLAALARTLATAAVIVAVFAGWAGGGGLGYALSQAWSQMEYVQAARRFGEIAALAILVDLLLGSVQVGMRSIDVR
jgi:hypothetical protein